MKLKDDIADEYALYRQEIMLNQTKKTFPVIGTVIIILVVLLLYMHLNTEQYGIGDPFHCKECKKLHIACKKHRGYDVKDELYKEIDTYTIHYIPGATEDEIKSWVYGKGMTYNTKCDFCLENKEECYGCQYERLRIQDLLGNISASGFFYSRLCDSCWELKYANCSSCRNMLATMIKEEISKENN